MTSSLIRQTVDNLTKESIVTRDQLQEICINFRDIDTDVFLSVAPRIGKTRMAINMLNPFEKVLVISPTQLIRDKWKQDILSHSFPVTFESICYQSVHKVKNEWDVIIIDEVDNSLTEKVFNTLKYFFPKRWIYLTGTTTWRTTTLINKLSKGRPLFTWTISTQTAIDWQILPVPEIILFGLNLQDDKTKRNQVYHIGKDKTKTNRVVRYGEHFQYLRGRKENLLVQVTEREWIDMCEGNIDRWKQMQQDIIRLDELRDKISNKIPMTIEEQVEFKELKEKLRRFEVPPLIISNNIKRLGLERKKFFALRKNRFIKKIVKHFNLEGSRVLIFANSIPQAEWIDEETSVHSGKDSAYLLDSFNKGEINKLVCVGMLDRGVDIIGVDTSIMIQCSGSESKNKQQSSRNMLDISPRLIIIYYKNSQDQTYVDDFVKQFKQEYVKKISPYE